MDRPTDTGGGGVRMSERFGQQLRCQFHGHSPFVYPYNGSPRLEGSVPPSPIPFHTRVPHSEGAGPVVSAKAFLHLTPLREPSDPTQVHQLRTVSQLLWFLLPAEVGQYVVQTYPIRSTPVP